MTWMLLCALLAAPARAETVDRIVVVVEDQLVLASEVRLEGVLAALDASPVPFWSARHGTPLERLVEAAAVRQVAGDVALHQPSNDEVRARVEQLRSHFPDRSSWSAFLTSWGLDEAALAQVVRRRMVVERYLSRNILASAQDPDAWLAECEVVLDRLRSRLRIREVPRYAEEP